MINYGFTKEIDASFEETLIIWNFKKPRRQ
jgi:hypothetical protein